MLSATFSVVTLYAHDVLKQRCKDIFFFVNVNDFLKKNLPAASCSPSVMQGLVEEVRKYVIPFLLDFANEQEQRQATTSQAQSRNCSSYIEVVT